MKKWETFHISIINFQITKLSICGDKKAPLKNIKREMGKRKLNQTSDNTDSVPSGTQGVPEKSVFWKFLCVFLQGLAVKINRSTG